MLTNQIAGANNNFADLFLTAAEFILPLLTLRTLDIILSISLQRIHRTTYKHTYNKTLPSKWETEPKLNRSASATPKMPRGVHHRS